MNGRRSRTCTTSIPRSWAAQRARDQLVVSLVLGQLLVLAYAAVRPRFGPGPGTAAAAAFLLFLPQSLLLASFGGWFLTWDFYFRQSVVMITMMAAGIAGAWVYAEEETEV